METIFTFFATIGAVLVGLICVSVLLVAFVWFWKEVLESSRLKK